jgi:hypothetical protein
VSLSNYGEEEAIVRVRFCVGKRMPEINCHVPARGCRLVSLESEFPEFCQDHSTELTAYLRFSCKSDAGVGVQVLECSRLSAANGPRLNIFSAIT